MIHTATSHLLELGHERIGYIGGTRDVPTASARLAGFHDAIASAGLSPDADLVRWELRIRLASVFRRAWLCYRRPRRRYWVLSGVCTSSFAKPPQRLLGWPLAPA